jgi:apolipoprotein N-acyltransferase
MRTFMLCGVSALFYGLVSPQLNWHILSWFLLIPLLDALEGRSLPASFSIGFLLGTLVHLICFSWVIDTVRLHSNLNFALSVLAWILFSLYSGTAFGILSLAYRFFELRLSLPAFVTLPVCYTAMEYAFPFVFPWQLGAVLYGVIPLIQISDVFGVHGVTALVVLVNCAFWDLLRYLRKDRRFPLASLSLALVLILSAWIYGAWRIQTIDALRTQARPFRVGMVQPNVRIQERSTPLLEEDIWNRYRNLSGNVVEQGADLVVWPESSIHFAYRPGVTSHAATGVLNRLAASFRKPLLFGSWSMGPGGPRNTAFLLNAQGEYQDHYDKVRLLAFGEYLPFSDWFPPVKEWIQGVGDFEPGDRLHPLCTGDVCFGVLICYEAILEGLSREFVNRGAEFLVNITNDVWFGDTKCPEQHLMLASFRAVENRVWMVRVANTGISACVDPLGRILCRTPLFQQADRICTVQLLQVPSVYKTWGAWFPVFCISLVLLLTLISLLRRS